MFEGKDRQVGECEEARQGSCKGCRVVLAKKNYGVVLAKKD